MDYTLSDSYATHSGTGQRLHRESQPVPTAWSEKDANMVIWSLMEIMKAGSVAGVQFDPDNPSTYQALTQAIRNLVAAGSGDLPGRVVMWLQQSAPAGYLPLHGLLLSRSTYSGLFAYASATSGLVTESAWSGGLRGCFSSGDGATTFRIPDWRGLFLRGLDESAGIDPGRVFGSVQTGQNASHSHGVTDPLHSHVVNDPTHAHNVSIPGVSTSDGSGPYQLTDSSDVGSSTRTFGSTSSATGITLQASSTGITIQSSGGTETRPINVAINFFIKF